MASNSMEQTPSPTLASRTAIASVCVLLVAVVWIVFGETLGFDFVNYDDNGYVQDNPEVKRGISPGGVLWAFDHAQIGHWAPLTTISHMLDCQLFRLWAPGHHLTNVLLHTASVVLLFLLLRAMTGGVWRSAFVAVVFAIHPLHVESVAWVSERKDVLSGLFFMLTLGSYFHYTRAPWLRGRYWAALGLFAMGLLSKDMLVTLPFVLLLLDYWPLKRFSPEARFVPRHLLVEKIPFFVLSAIACVFQIVVAEDATLTEKVSLPGEISNALVSYVTYFGQTIAPVNLAASYPNPENHFAVWKSIFSAALLAMISGAAFACRRKHPYVLVGWLWYLGMLVPPIIGFTRAGHAQSDRYTYLPQIGLTIAIAWLTEQTCATLSWGRRISAAGGLASILAFMWMSQIQATYWRDDQTLWKHALAVGESNSLAHNNLGSVLLQKKETEKAMAEFQRALQINPNDAEAHDNLGSAFLQDNQVDKAMEEYEKALQINPRLVSAHYNLGNVYLRALHTENAIRQYQLALEIDPDDVPTRSNLGYAFLLNGQLDQAREQYQMALKTNPDFADAQCSLGTILLHDGHAEEAATHFEKAIELNPRYITALNNLAYLRAASPQPSLRNGVQAVELARRADEAASGSDPVVLGTLAAAYAEQGMFSEAVKTAQRGQDIANSRSDKSRANQLQSQITLYESRMPLRDEALNGPGQSP